MRKSDCNRFAFGLWWDRALSLGAGCTPRSEGCDNCWSAEMAKTAACQKNEKIRARNTGLTVRGSFGQPRFNGVVRFQEQDLLKPFKEKKGCVWAIWNDLWHEAISDVEIALAMATFMCCPRHEFVVCTKVPERMPGWFERFTPHDCWRLAVEHHGGGFLRHARLSDVAAAWPLPNMVGMVSCETQEWADVRMPHLMASPFLIRAIALAPLLGPVDFSEWARDLDWCVAEEESGTYKRAADREWFRLARDICAESDVAFFLKQMLESGRLTKMPKLDGVFWDEFPAVGRAHEAIVLAE
jgi:protein gp37